MTLQIVQASEKLGLWVFVLWYSVSYVYLVSHASWKWASVTIPTRILFASITGSLETRSQRIRVFEWTIYTYVRLASLVFCNLKYRFQKGCELTKCIGWHTIWDYFDDMWYRPFDVNCRLMWDPVNWLVNSIENIN